MNFGGFCQILMPPLGPAGEYHDSRCVLRGLSCRLAFFRWKNQHYRGFNLESVQSDVFYRENRGLCQAPPGNDNTIEDSTTWGAGARDLGDLATGRRAKHGTFGTTVAPFPGERRGPFEKRTTLSRNRRHGWRPGR